MTTLCLECGEQIESRIDFIEGLKTIRHLNEHPDIKELFRKNQELVTETCNLEDGETLHLVGEMVSYTDDDGQLTIQVDG